MTDIPRSLGFLLVGSSASPGALLNMNKVQFLPCPQSPGGIHEPDNDLDRNLVQEDIVLRPTSAVTIKRIRSDFTSNHRIPDFFGFT